MELTYTAHVSAEWVDSHIPRIVGPCSNLYLGPWMGETELNDGEWPWRVRHGLARVIAHGAAPDRDTAKRAAETAIREHANQDGRDA